MASAIPGFTRFKFEISNRWASRSTTASAATCKAPCSEDVQGVAACRAPTFLRRSLICSMKGRVTSWSCRWSYTTQPCSPPWVGQIDRETRPDTVAPRIPDGMTQSSADAANHARPQGSARTTNQGSTGKRESPARLRRISPEMAPFPVQPSTKTMFSAPWA